MIILRNMRLGFSLARMEKLVKAGGRTGGAKYRLIPKENPLKPAEAQY